MTAPRDAGEVVRYDYTPHPAQARAHAVATDELLYGGAAGGGKSRFGRALAVLYALRFPGIKVIILRRTFPQLRDAVEQPMRAELPPGLATYNKTDHTFTFRNGSMIQLGYLRHETDVENYQGAEYQLCVARDTPVLMADGAWRRIDSVRVGEMVQTLQGPREVTATHDMGVKPVARVTTPHGSSLVSMRHRVLTASGWAAPGELIPTRSRDAHADGASSAETCPCGGTLPVCPQSDRPRAGAPAQPGAARTPRPGSCACAAGGRSGCAASGDGRREGPPPAVWCGPLVLYGPDRRSAGIPGPCPCGGGSCAGPASAAPGSTPGCPPCSRCGDARAPHPAGAGGRACPPSRGGADACSRCVSRADGLGRIPGRTPAGRFEYAHPYTSERVVVHEDAHVGPGCMTPAGEAHLWDLTVAGANHYVSWGNIITQNCIFEEVTHFTESQYLYMKSRLRAAGPVRDMLEAAGLRPRIVSTGNPGSIGHLWVKARFVDPAPPGTVFRVKPSDRDRNPGTRVFIPARATDNPSLNAEYLQELDQLPPDLRAALRDGDWDRLSGVRFESWDRAVHVIRPEDLPLTPGQGLRAVGVDYGSSAPFAALWGCKLSDDLVVIYRELYLKGLTPRQQAEAIRAAEAEDERIPDARPIPIALDPSTWARAADKPLAQVRNGIPPEGSIARAYHDVFPGQVVKAWNERVAGWALLDEHLRVRDDGLPRLLVYNTCTNLIRTLPAIPRDKRRPEDVDCFVAGTLIRTPDGAVPVEQLQVGDLVETPTGPQRVLKAHPEARVPVARVDFSDGTHLVGTADHEVVVHGRGLVALKDVNIGDSVSTWLNLTPATRSDIAGSLTAANLGAPTTPRPAGQSLSMAAHPYTATSTVTITGPSLTGGTSTTLTGTRRTTTPRTSKQSAPQITPGTTTPSAPSDWQRAVLSGWRLPRGAKCAAGRPPKCAPTHLREKRRALIAGLLSRHEQGGSASTATTTASTRPDAGRTCAPAPYAGPCSAGRSTESVPPERVATRVDGSYGVETVYALTVDDCALYYANDVLCTNTHAEDHALDACRYLLAQLAGKHRADPDRPAPAGAALAATADLRTRAW